MECVRPSLRISSCSFVRLCEERLVTVWVEENGRTMFRVRVPVAFSSEF